MVADDLRWERWCLMRKGRTLYHCHGAKKGKKLRSYGSVVKAKAAHRAMVKKRGK